SRSLFLVLVLFLDSRSLAVQTFPSAYWDREPADRGCVVLDEPQLVSCPCPFPRFPFLGSPDVSQRVLGPRTRGPRLCRPRPAAACFSSLSFSSIPVPWQSRSFPARIGTANPRTAAVSSSTSR